MPGLLCPPAAQQQMRPAHLPALCCRLGFEANLLHTEANRLSHFGLVQKQRRYAEEAQQRQVAAFRAALADCLMCGLVVVLAVLPVCGVQMGFWQRRLGACRPLRVMRWWHPWTLLQVCPL